MPDPSNHGDDDLFDATCVPQGAKDALEPEDDFDPDEADEAELEEVGMADADLDEPRSFVRDDADLVADAGAQPAEQESDGLADDNLETLGEDADAPTTDDVDAALDEGLNETFPASDPVSISPRSG